MLLLRHGEKLDFTGMPLMSQDNIAKKLGVNQNNVGRFLRKFFYDNEIPWEKKLWWKKPRFAKYHQDALFKSGCGMPSQCNKLSNNPSVPSRMFSYEQTLEMN